jgi:heptosyltransferase I
VSRSLEPLPLGLSRQRILIVRMWALGDILMATPIASSLKRKYPSCFIAWLADRHYAEVLRGNPFIDEVIEIDSGTWTRQFRGGRLIPFIKNGRRLRTDLHARKFDVVVNLSPEKWWTAWFLVAPEKIGLYKAFGSKLRSGPTATSYWHTTVLTRPVGAGAKHNTEHYLQAARALGCTTTDTAMSIGETPDEAPFAATFWGEHGLGDGMPVIVFAPFATSANRCWDSERFAELASRLYEDYRAHVIITHAPRDESAAREIQRLAKSGAVVVASGTSVRESIALIRRADLIVCVDSAPMHIAGALGKPFVALFGSSPADERMPLNGTGIAVYKHLACAPCDLPTCSQPIFGHCMKLISVEDVKAAVSAKLLDARPPGSERLCG